MNDSVPGTISEDIELISNRVIERVSENQSLEKLFFRRCSLEGIDFSPLRKLKRLKFIQLTLFTPITALPDLLRNTPDIETLNISDAGPFSTALMRKITSLDSLRNLFISYCTGFGETSLLPLDSCTTLDRLSLIGLEMTSTDLEFVTTLTNLAKLDLGNNRLAGCDLRPLAQNRRLRELLLDQNRIEALDLTPLSSCKKLNTLDLLSNRLREIDLTPLAQCDITRFIAARNQLQQVDLAPLGECTNLEGLMLFDNRLERIDLSPLTTCKNLVHIDLSDNRLRTIDLTPLSGCHRLETLRLEDNPIRELDTSPVDSLQSLTNFEHP